MRVNWVKAAALAVAFMGAGVAQAQDIVVPIDMAAPVRLVAPAEGIAIGNPAIAGVSVQNDTLLFITGRSYGATNLVVVGRGGRTLFNGRIIVTSDDAGVVTLTRGSETLRLACAPQCRPRPDIGDSTAAFDAVTNQITTRASVAGASRTGN